MAKLEDSLSDSKTFTAWAGSPNDLLPVLQAMERQYRDLRGPFIQERMRHRIESQEYSERALATAEARMDGAGEVDPVTRSEYAERVQRAENDVRDAKVATSKARASYERVDHIDVEITTKKGAERRTSGSSEEVAEYLAHKIVRDMTLSTPAGPMTGHRISIDFDRATGVRLSVTSTDSRWALSALGEVADTLAPGVPAWGWLRGQIFLSVFFLGSVLTAVLLLTQGLSDGLDTTALALFSVFRGLAVAALATSGVALTRAFVPGFEILPPGGKARVDRLVVALASGLVTIALGIFINAVS